MQFLVKDSKGRFSTKIASKDDFQEDAALVMAAIRGQAKLKLDKNGRRDMQLLFTADAYENIESILNHQLNSSNGFGCGTIEFIVGYKSIYFETKGSVIVAITKRIEKDTSLHHRSVIAMLSGNR